MKSKLALIHKIEDEIEDLREQIKDCEDMNSHYMGLLIGEISGFQKCIELLEDFEPGL